MGGSNNEVKETALEKEQAKVAAEQWNDYQKRFVPIENRFILDVTGIDPKTGQADEDLWAQRKADVAGQANADIMQATDGGGALPLGDPNLGAALTGASTRGQSQAMARGAVNANTAVDDQRATGMGAVVDLGRGQSTEASLGYEKLATEAAQGAIDDAKTRAQNTKFYGDTFGSAMGVVASKTGYREPGSEEAIKANDSGFYWKR